MASRFHLQAAAVRAGGRITVIAFFTQQMAQAFGSTAGAIGDADHKGQELKVHVDGVDRSVVELTSLAKSTIKGATAASKTSATLVKHLGNAAALENVAQLQGALNGVAQALSQVDGHRCDVLVRRFQDTLRRRLEDTREHCVKPTKKLLADRDNAFKRLHALRRARDKLGQKKNVRQAKIDEKSQEIRDEQRKIENTDASVDENILKFERRRLADMKAALDEFVRGELFWHCRALELYTKAAELVARVDPEAHTDALREKLAQHRN